MEFERGEFILLLGALPTISLILCNKFAVIKCLKSASSQNLPRFPQVTFPLHLVDIYQTTLQMHTNTCQKTKKTNKPQTGNQAKNSNQSNKTKSESTKPTLHFFSPLCLNYNTDLQNVASNGFSPSQVNAFSYLYVNHKTKNILYTFPGPFWKVALPN